MDKISSPDRRIRLGIWISRELWGKIRTKAFDEGVKPEAVAERFLVDGLRGRRRPSELRGEAGARSGGGGK